MVPSQHPPRFPDMPAFEAGWVWLVGAGPGDPGLLTLLAHHALGQADVVVYDALVDDDILNLANPDAELIYAGKRGGKPSPKQPDISDRLVSLALAGNRVLRLKGGDPFVFGRGGEEALTLVAAGVPFRVVPGITAGVGGLAYAGIPATHRETNHSVAFITGHMAGGEVPDGIDWAALASGGQALVIYMALKHLEAIAGFLVEGGLAPSTPVAVVSRAATKHQWVLETVLGDAAGDVEASGIEAPAIVAVGEIVRMRAGLDWLGAIEGRTLDPDPLGQTSQRKTG
ncbi:MAG: uroporphyrinogen-III C-methyltransferase [Rhodospirillaceae bacterium]|jgi:uroporphyrin-III C-methyltransferase|nr:uroporphyrinogen-III C-methyltransferase [Rhodospirillaceae bacterium]MBT6512823.1 uroporphyrinogen-III C-methyltransferase [Rhodospirillaceae bacterium]MBT7615266.1 uroporphyrinogen-III C-methyltransferase [Rhodospirillaceae bacterium]